MNREPPLVAGPQPGTSGKSKAGSAIAFALKRARRIVVFVVGGTLLIVGIALLFLPGPAFLVIPAALTVLALEFAWARRWLHKLRSMLPSSSGTSAGQERVIPPN